MILKLRAANTIACQTFVTSRHPTSVNEPPQVSFWTCHVLGFERKIHWFLLHGQQRGYDGKKFNDNITVGKKNSTIFLKHNFGAFFAGKFTSSVKRIRQSTVNLEKSGDTIKSQRTKKISFSTFCGHDSFIFCLFSFLWEFYSMQCIRLLAFFIKREIDYYLDDGCFMFLKFVDADSEWHRRRSDFLGR